MESFVIRDVPINFPFEPYPCQLDYMTKVIEALDTSSNALLESPTGTGKTLCLLVASLAWLQKNKSRSSGPKMTIQYENALSSMPSRSLPVPGQPTSAGGSSIIIYASRTHSQLSQVISELRASGYSPKMTVMGSREQLCIHEKISKLKGAALNHACSASGAQRRCSYKNNLETYTSSAGILDIEELAELGREDQVCPYFLSRQNATSSELILLPYNYLIDASIRATLKVEWNDAIVILDEAHNIEKVASDASSFALTSADIAACIQEMKNVIQLLQLTDTVVKASVDKKSSGGAEGVARKPSLQKCATILKALFDLEAFIDRVPLSANSGGVKLTGGAKCAALPGEWLIEVLDKVGINSFTATQLISEIRVCADFILDDANSMLGGSGFGGGGSGPSIPDPKLVSFASSLGKVFKTSGKTALSISNKPNAEDFRVFLKEEPKNNYSSAYSRRGEGGVGGGGSDKRRVLNYWCFSPGVAMEDLKALGVRSLILTSGTLSPMDAFKEDMKVPFTVELENPHVIDNNQIWISAMASGPGGSQLLSTYERRDTNEYKDELGKSILSICQNMMGGQSKGTMHPTLNGGVLVFFPSYGTMETATSRWKESGLWLQLSQVMGKVVSETQSKKNNWTGNPKELYKNSSYSNRNETWTSGGGQKQSQAHWKSATTTQTGNNTTNDRRNDAEIVAGIIQEFEEALSLHGKCLLLAVCRGKVSEGIDFKDNKGRVAIMTGIPFSPYMDPWVVLKKQYLDDNCKSKGLFFASTPSQDNQSSTAMKAVQYKPPSQYQPSSQYKPSALILSGTMQPIKPTNLTGSQRPAASSHGSGSQRLTGNAWYVQSASRAVNQALGRVIRHKHDWGAVFLLDSRYQRPDQQQQLSGWIRPHVSKHLNFLTALTSFRSFCTDALQNESLAVKIDEMDGVVKSHRKPFVPPTLVNEQNTYQKSMIVKSEALMNSNTGDEEINYINPSMTMSQSSFDSLYNGHKGNGGRGGFSQVQTSNPVAAKERQGPPPASDLNSISKMFTIIKNSSKSNSMSTVLSSAGSSASVQLAPFKSPLDSSHENLLARKMRQQGVDTGMGIMQASQNSSSSQSNNIATSRQGSGLSKHDTFTTNTSANRLSQTQDSSQSQSSGAFFNMSTAQASADKKRKSDGKVKFKALIGDLNTKLSPKCFEKFINQIKVIAALSKASGGQVENVSEVRSFVDVIVKILISELPSGKLHEAVDVLSSLFQEKHLSIYKTASKNIIKQLSFSAQPPSSQTQQSASQKNTTPRSLEEQNFSSSQVQSSSQFGSDSNNSSNKRGFQMMNSINKNSSLRAPPSHPSKDIFSALKNINIEKVNNKSRATSSCESDDVPNTQQEKVKKARLDCIICSSPPSSPLINECGHICCEECWETWLRVKRTCPLCRVETHKFNLSRLILK